MEFDSEEVERQLVLFKVTGGYSFLFLLPELTAEKMKKDEQNSRDCSEKKNWTHAYEAG